MAATTVLSAGGPAEPAKQVTFIEYDLPPLKPGEYTVELAQDVTVDQQLHTYTTTRKFAVVGERFAFRPEELNSVFPPNLANGEFAGVFPQVLFNRRTLPWERPAVRDEPLPGLAVLLLNADELALLPPANFPERSITSADSGPVRPATAKDLVPTGQPITVWGASTTGTGALPAGYCSYPGLEKLDYGETPDDQTNVLDLPATLFTAIAPTVQDLPLLAHVRATETIDKNDQQAKEDGQYAVVLGNRLPKTGAGSVTTTSYAFLVSLENMGAYLPGADGSSHLPSGTQFVRLICYQAWSFTANNAGQNFKALLEGLNRDAQGQPGLSSLQFPFAGSAPTPDAVRAALLRQAQNQLAAADAQTLVHSAFTMGFMPMNHYLRVAGNTVSWYRGPLAPYPVADMLQVPISCADAANRYNPETGLFEVSYGAAWQIGQLLALQNKGFAATLYNWKRGQRAQEVMAAEQQIIQEKYQALPTAFGRVLRLRDTRLLHAAQDEPLAYITDWLGRLALLQGVPFNYLVPDERMLPPESLRFFYLDNNWIDALLDGAFSIGRANTGEQARDVRHVARLLPRAKLARQNFRRRKPALLTYKNATGTVTGLLLRSAVVSGWPGLEINGYSDAEGQQEIQKLRMERLSDQVLLCLFDGVVQMVAIHEPAEALHGGVEIDAAGTGLSTTLRRVNNPQAGSQLLGVSAPVPSRPDGQTVQVAAAAASILKTLNEHDQNLASVTSAEYGLEIIKGVVKVEFIHH